MEIIKIAHDIFVFALQDCFNNRGNMFYPIFLGMYTGLIITCIEEPIKALKAIKKKFA